MMVFAHGVVGELRSLSSATRVLGVAAEVVRGADALLNFSAVFSAS